MSIEQPPESRQAEIRNNQQARSQKFPFLLYLFWIIALAFIPQVLGGNNEQVGLQTNLHSIKEADYSADQRYGWLPGINISILEHVIQDHEPDAPDIDHRMATVISQLLTPVPTVNSTEAKPDFFATPTASKTTQATIEIVQPTSKPSQANTSIPSPLPTLQPTITQTRPPIPIYQPNTTTPTKTPKAPPIHTATITPSPTQIFTSTATQTATLSYTLTPSVTLTQSLTPVETKTSTIQPTLTYTIIPTSSSTSTSTSSPFFTPTSTSSNSSTPTPTDTTTYTPSPTHTPSPEITATLTPSPPTMTPTSTNTPLPGACSYPDPVTGFVLSIFPAHSSVGEPPSIQPIIHFNQPMNINSLTYGDERHIVLLRCTSEACNQNEIVPATISIGSNVYLNDTVVILPNENLWPNQLYRIIAGNQIRNHPDCGGMNQAVRVRSDFQTGQ